MIHAPEVLLRKAAIRETADEIVDKWWCGPYAPGKVALVECIIERLLERLDAIRDGLSR